MAVRTRVEPINRDIEVLLSDALGPAARSQILASFAREQIDQAQETNANILGRKPRAIIAVDGKKDAPLESVKPDGFILAEFVLIDDVLRWIAEQLETHSPRLTGRFRKNNTLFADGTEVALGAVIPTADEYVFTNTLPYTRKIERGLSKQAPDGVFQAVATLAARRFGNIAKITFSYRTSIGGSFVGGREGNRSDQRNPAIIVRLVR